MAQIEIPEQWRKTVCAILATDDDNLIWWEPTGRKRYEATPGCIWTYEAHDAFRQYLEQAHPTGCPITTMRSPGETYEFFFQFKRRKFYGKILLRPSKSKIDVYSAHPPLKEKLSCEMDDGV